MNAKLMSVVILAILLSGCAAGVKRAQPDGVAKPCLSDRNQVSSVSVSMTDEAKKKALDNLKFNPDELLDHVKRGLEAGNLLNGAADRTLPHLEVLVKDMRVRSNFSAVMWGFMAGADSITADIVLEDEAGKELDRFEVSASYALGGLAGGQDSARMSWLYEKFAEETVRELTRLQ
jgi:hypothetical protein